jgi:nucleotide-binding universal stress UspA family protein
VKGRFVSSVHRMTLLAPDRVKRSSRAESRGGLIAVVGHDGSPAAAEVLAHAALRAGPGGRVVVVHALPAGEDWAGYADAVNAVLQSIESALPAGMSYELRVVAGSESQALQDAASRSDADVIILGARA